MQMLADADAECRCRCKADAECRMQMQNAVQMQIALRKNTLMLSQAACAPEVLGRIPVLTPTAACVYMAGSEVREELNLLDKP